MPFSVILVCHFFQMFSFFTFFSVSLFTFLGCFHFSFFSCVFNFHLSQVFPFFHFLMCFISDLFLVVLCCSTASATNLRDFFSHTYFTLHSFWSATDLSERFLFEVFFALHSSPIFDTTCFYRGFPESRNFFLE